ncbi:MAG TPA: TIM-barrel domain-containing protein [Solirubrobacteraceae bacterium]|nr:TIM-barrel domain-containing protein [Solirubrobacteraceae bacterium]
MRRIHGGLRLTLATNDPAGRRLLVAVRATGGGVISVDARPTTAAGRAPVTQMADSFASGPGEHFTGFGGRENLLDQSGHTVENWAEEGTWLPSDRPLIPASIEPWTYSTRDDGAYFPMPWLVSSRGYGFLLGDSERSLFRLRSDRGNAWDVEVDASHLDYRVFAGPRPLNVVRRFSATVGRQPPIRAPWVLGPWWQPTGPADATLPARFRREDVPGSLIMTYTHYLPGGGQDDRSERAQVRRLHSAGYAVTTYVNPMISVQYQPAFAQAQSAGALLENQAGQPYPLHYNQYHVAEFDFTAAAGRTFYQRLLQQPINNGYDGWMEDFGEYTPPDAVAHNGTPGSVLHNLYPRLYHCAAFALASRQPRPIVEFDRSGWTGSAACAPVVWSGDPTTDWDRIDGLPAMVTQGLNYGYSGVGFYGSDIGGYFSLTAPPTSSELLARWLEMGAFSGVMRTESEGVGRTPRAQIWDRDVEPIWRRYAKLRTQLYPYTAAASHRYEQQGVPLMEALGLAYPQDPRSWRGPARYLFGPDLLVAPVTAPGVRAMTVPLPGGHWLDFWQAVSYARSDGGFHLRPATPLRGDAAVHVDAPLDQIPLFVRAGTLLPLLSPDVATLAAYGRGVVHLSDRRRRLHVLAWPSGTSSTVALGTRLRSRLTGQTWSLRVSGVPPLALQLEAAVPGCITDLRWRTRGWPAHRFSIRRGILRTVLRGDGTLKATIAARRPASHRRLGGCADHVRHAGLARASRPS